MGINISDLYTCLKTMMQLYVLVTSHFKVYSSPLCWRVAINMEKCWTINNQMMFYAFLLEYYVIIISPLPGVLDKQSLINKFHRKWQITKFTRFLNQRWETNDHKTQCSWLIFTEIFDCPMTESAQLHNISDAFPIELIGRILLLKYFVSGKLFCISISITKTYATFKTYWSKT